MRLPNNLRLRFALWSSALVFLTVLVYGLVVYTAMNVFLHGAILEKLKFGADQVVSSLEFETGMLQPPDAQLKTGGPKVSGGPVAVRVYDLWGKLIFEDGPAMPLPGPIFEALSHPVYRALDHDMAVWAVPVMDQGAVVGLVEVAQSAEPAEQALHQLLLVLAGLLPLFLIGSGVGGYFLATRLMKPIDLMTKTARRFSEEDLSARIGLPHTDDEFGRLAATFDEMLGRIEDSFLRYRQFTADASHELRTPVSVIQSILTVTKRRPRSPEEYREVLDDLTAAADRLEALVSGLVVLSRTDSDPPNPSAAIDLTQLVGDVVASLRPIAETKHLALDAELEPDLTIEGDSDALVHVFVNVIDNALAYTVSGGVSVTGRRGPRGVVIEVRDTGIGIPPEHLERIFDRFYRVDPSRSRRGSGLGLAIARSVVERHGGVIEAESTLGSGTLIRVVLPNAAR